MPVPVSYLLMPVPLEGQSLSVNQISSTYLNWRLRYNYFRFWKTNVRHIGNLLSVSISIICPKSAHYSASVYRISSKSKHPLRKYDVMSISQGGPRRLNTTSGFAYDDVTAFRRKKSISRPNFVDIFQIAAEIYIYWNSTSDFVLDQFAVICMLFCIRLPNFVQIEAATAEIWRHIHFSRWRPRPLNTTSGFVFVDVTALEGQSLSANQISSRYLNLRLKYNYFRFWKTNVCHIGNLLSVSISIICPKSAHYSASGYRISFKSEHPLRKYDVISISQNGGRHR